MAGKRFEPGIHFTEMGSQKYLVVKSFWNQRPPLRLLEDLPAVLLEGLAPFTSLDTKLTLVNSLGLTPNSCITLGG